METTKKAKTVPKTDNKTLPNGLFRISWKRPDKCWTLALLPFLMGYLGLVGNSKRSPMKYMRIYTLPNGLFRISWKQKSAMKTTMIMPINPS